jgi:hypothetical protein
MSFNHKNFFLADTPLVTTVVQEVREDSVVAKDNRLQPGDHILRVD